MVRQEPWSNVKGANRLASEWRELPRSAPPTSASTGTRLRQRRSSHADSRCDRDRDEPPTCTNKWSLARAHQAMATQHQLQRTERRPQRRNRMPAFAARAATYGERSMIYVSDDSDGTGHSTGPIGDRLSSQGRCQLSRPFTNAGSLVCSERRSSSLARMTSIISLARSNVE